MVTYAAGRRGEREHPIADARKSTDKDKGQLNLDPQQVKQAETQRKAADGTVTARLPETFQWLLVPTQASPQSSVELQAFRLSGTSGASEQEVARR